MSGVKRRYQGVPVMQLAIEDYPANNLPKVQEIILEQKITINVPLFKKLRDIIFFVGQ